MLPSVDSSDQLIERLAQAIERKGMRGPAIFFLEANKPLSFVASQGLLLLQPLLSLALGGRLTMDVALLFQERANVDLLIDRLERGSG